MYDARNLNLLRELVVSQFKVKDQSTALGLLWSLLHPLVMLAVLFGFFHMKLGGEIEHYGVYLLIGLVHYTHFSNTTSAALRVLRATPDLTSQTIFPKELIVFSTVAIVSVEFVVSMLICLGIAAITGVSASLAWLWIPVVMVLQLLLVIWVSLILASIYPFARDLEHIYQIFLRILFFATPIFYDVSILGDGLIRKLASLNPLYHLVIFSRGLILQGTITDSYMVPALLLLNVLLAALAFGFFKRMEPWFAENV